MLPPTYPLRPPSFRFVTPSGRFEANREICLSISGHHEETWQPAWGLRTALVALRTFMETDPKGQLGGLDTSDAVRRRLAAESRAWRCPVCARSNAAIIDDAAREAAAAPGSSSAEVTVPAELKMGWRDEMKAAAAAAASQQQQQPKEGDETVIRGTTGESVGDMRRRGEDERDSSAPGATAESAELAEGFVQTVAAPSSPSAPEEVPLPARPGQTVPQPTRTIPLRIPVGGGGGAGGVVQRRPQSAQRRQIQQQHGPAARRNLDEAVPLWLDRAIVIVCVLLAVMVLKVLAGL